jgi:DNA-binding NtrC family response regulator
MNEKTIVLVVGHDPSQAAHIARALSHDGLDCAAVSAKETLEHVRRSQVGIIITDIAAGDVTGLELMATAREVDPDLPFIVTSAYGTIRSAVEVMKKGANDYLPHPLDLEELRDAVREALRHRRRTALRKVPAKQNGGAKPTSARKPESAALALPGMVGGGKWLTEVSRVVSKVAAARATILIRGQSGTGKELVARAVHVLSERAARPFVAVACSALSSDLLESELFGHERGAFTGAVAQKPGRFELADGGTLFLDEIGDITPNLQLKLLRALQEREFERVGGTKTLRVDVRVIAATNRDLESAVASGRFREDLYYRLQVVQINLPTLRDRVDDVPELAYHFLEKFSKENGGRLHRIPSDVMELLGAYPWPGNVRELENAMEHAVVLADADDESVHMGLLPPRILAHSCKKPKVSVARGRPNGDGSASISRQPGRNSRAKVRGTKENPAVRKTS